jgi:hypothetical protein
MGAIQFRARNPSTSVLDTDLYAVDPLRDAFQRFASGATLAFIDSDGTKLSQYPYGTRVEVQYSTDNGLNYDTRFAGVCLTPTQTTRDGLPAVEVDIVGYSHLLTRGNVVADYSSTARSTILNDLITTYTSVNWVPGNVTVQNDDVVDMTFRGQTVDQAIDQIAAESANEEWGVNNSLEFFFREQSSASAIEVIDPDVIDYDLPEAGKRNINQYKLYYGSGGSDAVVVSDRDQQQELKEKLNAPRGVVISASDHIPEITSQARAEAVARQRLNDQSVIQTGTVTVPLGRFETESGDVFPLTISDAGISEVDFRVAQIDYYWGRSEAELTIAENTGGNVEELLIGLSDQLTNTRLRDADPNADEVEFIDFKSGIEVRRRTTITAKTPNSGGTIMGQSELGQGTGDTLGAGVTASTVADRSHKATVPFLNLVRDLWLNGASAYVDISHMGLGTDTTAATRGDKSLGSPVGRVELDKFGDGGFLGLVQFIATVPPGGQFAEVGDFREFGVFDAASAGNLYDRVTHDPIGVDATTYLNIDLVLDIDDDADQQGFITRQGQQRTRDLIVGESGHEPTDVVYGTGTTQATASDTSLETKQHEDGIDTRTAREPGVALFSEETTAGEANTQNWSEIGLENAANELLSRIVFRSLAEDKTLVLTYEWQVVNF